MSFVSAYLPLIFSSISSARSSFCHPFVQQLVTPVFGSAGPIVSPAVDLDEVFSGELAAEHELIIVMNRGEGSVRNTWDIVRGRCNKAYPYTR